MRPGKVTRNLKRVTATAITAMILTLGIYSQPDTINRVTEGPALLVQSGEIEDTTVTPDKPIYLVQDDLYTKAWSRKFVRNNKETPILVGYYESTKTPIWTKIRKIFNSGPIANKSSQQVTGTAYIYM